MKCMVCCFLVHGPRYETVECTQDMHNEHRNKDLKLQKRKQEQSCDANAHLSIPESFRVVLIRRSLKKKKHKKSFPFLSFLKLQPYVHGKEHLQWTGSLKCFQNNRCSCSVERWLYFLPNHFKIHTVWTWKWFVHHVWKKVKRQKIVLPTLGDGDAWLKKRCPQHYDNWFCLWKKINRKKDFCFSQLITTGTIKHYRHKVKRRNPDESKSLLFTTGITDYMQLLVIRTHKKK